MQKINTCFCAYSCCSCALRPPSCATFCHTVPGGRARTQNIDSDVCVTLSLSFFRPFPHSPYAINITYRIEAWLSAPLLYRARYVTISEMWCCCCISVAKSTLTWGTERRRQRAGGGRTALVAHTELATYRSLSLLGPISTILILSHKQTHALTFSG